jgi:membrane-associated protease RseP (regulator of RpoE activity)
MLPPSPDCDAGSADPPPRHPAESPALAPPEFDAAMAMTTLSGPATARAPGEAGNPASVRAVVPVLLFVATCVSTFLAGAADWLPFDVLGDGEALYRTVAEHAVQGLVYMTAVMSILLSHEMGHFLTARRYRVHASLPYFLPVPMHPLGTLGAVIGMKGTHANRRQLFDIGLAGPLAGLIVMIPCLWLGINQLDPNAGANSHLPLRNPLLLEYLLKWFRPDLPAALTTHLLQLNAFLMAAWVAMLVTGLNMLPISQLDGGHVLYALLGRRAIPVARTLLIAGIALIVVFEQYHWSIMVVLLCLLGVDHPPTEDDAVRLDGKRQALGWLCLALPILCMPWFEIVG